MSYDLLFRRLLLIYQMPKTGSQTVEATLQQCELPHQISRIHFLSRYMTTRMRKAMRSAEQCQKWKRSVRKQLDDASKLTRTIRLRKILRLFGIRVPKLEVITGVREILGQAISAAFENQVYLTAGQGALHLEACRDLLLRPRMFVPLDNWFDWEINAKLGIDVYQTPFPREQGYAIFEGHFAGVLVYRMEAISNLAVMRREFLGCDIPNIINRNLGSSKSYAGEYSFVLDRLRLPAEFVAARYGTKMMQHFYSSSERRTFELRWGENGQEEAGSSVTNRANLASDTFEASRIGTPGR